MREAAGEIWEQALSVQPVPDPAVVLALGVVAALLVAMPLSWPRVRLAVTLVHEAGHAVAAVLVGRRLGGIRLHSDTSGLTVSRGRPRGPGMVVMLAAGYLAPAVVGIGAALLLAAGRSLGLLWALVVVLVLMLGYVRNLYGFAVVLGTGAAVVGVTYLDPGLQSAAAYLVAWVLLLAAPKPVVELMISRRRGGARGCDADQLARLTRIPAPLWLLFFLVANLAGLALGVATLLPELLPGS